MNKIDAMPRTPSKSKRSGRTRPLLALGWLLFLAYPIAGFLAQSRSPAEWLLFWGVLLAFAALYVAFQWRETDTEAADIPATDARWALLGYVGALLAFALLWGVVGSYALGLLIYGAFMAGDQPSRPLVLACTTLSAAILAGLAYLAAPEWLGQSWSWAVPVGFALLVAFLLFSALISHAGWKENAARRALAREQVRSEQLAAEAERERIARDLHDLLGHTLSVIVLKSELAGKLVHISPERAAAEIGEVERISREALCEVRAAVRGMQGSGFEAELARARVALDAAGIRLRVVGAAAGLSAEPEHTLAMVLREGVTNAVRHSGADELRVELQRVGAQWRLTLTDDGGGGTGFSFGTGLGSMRERVRALGGGLECGGLKGGGWQVVAWLPMLKAEADA